MHNGNGGIEVVIGHGMVNARTIGRWVARGIVGTGAQHLALILPKHVQATEILCNTLHRELGRTGGVQMVKEDGLEEALDSNTGSIVIVEADRLDPWLQRFVIEADAFKRRHHLYVTTQRAPNDLVRHGRWTRAFADLFATVVVSETSSRPSGGERPSRAQTRT